MRIAHHHRKVKRTAHYSTWGELSKETRSIWFFFHGYGQLASKVIGKFRLLDGTKHFVIAPEGLSRFYWHENNQPVSSWMTRMDRYHEIEDLVCYLDELYDLYARHVHDDVKKNFMGFSQGCATAWRWIHASQPAFDCLINWAGWIPEDIGYKSMKDYLTDRKIYLHYGVDDQYLTDDVIESIGDVIRENQLDVDISSFKGGHRIPVDEMRKFLADRDLI